MMSKPFFVIVYFIFTSIFDGNFFESEFFLVKKICVEKKLGRKFFGVNKIFGWNIFFGSNKICVGIFVWVKKFGLDIFLGKKKILSEILLG